MRDCEAVQQIYRDAINAESKMAYEHRSDNYYTSNGRNISQDEYAAIHYAGKINLAPSEEETADPRKFALRLLSDLEAIKADFRISENDPHGFGIGTLHTISRKLTAFVESLGVGQIF
jgi:hypothetical protein